MLSSAADTHIALYHIACSNTSVLTVHVLLQDSFLFFFHPGLLCKFSFFTKLLLSLLIAMGIVENFIKFDYFLLLLSEMISR